MPRAALRRRRRPRRGYARDPSRGTATTDKRLPARRTEADDIRTLCLWLCSCENAAVGMRLSPRGCVRWAGFGLCLSLGSCEIVAPVDDVNPDAASSGHFCDALPIQKV